VLKRDGDLTWQPLRTVLASPPPPPIPPPLPGTTESALPPKPGQSDGPKGVGGWLLFFCVGLTVLSPLLTLGQMVVTWEQSTAAFPSFPSIKSVLIWENLGSTVLLVYGLIVGYMVWSGSPRGRELAKRYLLIRLFGFVGIEVIALLMMSGLPSKMVEEGVAAALANGTATAIFFLLWWLYFTRSKRVRNTYGNANERSTSSRSSEHKDPPTASFDCVRCARRLRLQLGRVEATYRCPTCRTEYTAVQVTGSANVFLVAPQLGPREQTAGTIATARRHFPPEVKAALGTFGLEETKTFHDVRQAYRELVKSYHPDMVAHLGPELRRLADEKTREINSAYRILETLYAAQGSS
jgi:hypothetical protein